MVTTCIGINQLKVQGARAVLPGFFIINGLSKISNSLVQIAIDYQFKIEQESAYIGELAETFMNPLQIKRVTLRILLVSSTCIAIALVAVSYSKSEWETMAASLSVITAILAIWSSLNLTWKQEDDKLPQIAVFIDNLSHKYAYSLAIKNEGGSPAYNVRIDWITPILDFEDKAPRFVDYEDDFDFHYLGASNQYSRFLIGSDRFKQLVRDANEPLIFEGIISYSFSLKGKYREKRNFKVSLEPFRKRLNNANDQMDFYFENKKVAEYLKSISESLQELRKANQSED